MSANEKFLISGFYCGPSPSAGLGIARSLRAAWPQAKIIGMDYWSGSSGLHHEALSERMVFPSWDLLDLDAHAGNLRKYCEDHLIFSALDAEISWFASAGITSENLMVPGKQSIRFAEKPMNRIGDLLPFRRPAIHVDNGDDQELFDFCRAQSWRVWVKGAYHGARFVNNWRDLSVARAALAGKGNVAAVSYQQHIRGVEESICFSAWNGELCGAVHMQKRVTTPEGKTWSGKVRPLADHQMDVVAKAVRATHWTGGGELELIRDESGTYWLMEFNPRFPAWIHGATIAGVNLPALLVERRLGIRSQSKLAPVTSEFTRIVTEIPVLSEIALPQVQYPGASDVAMSGKYGASYGALEAQLAVKEDEFRSDPFSDPAPESIQEIEKVLQQSQAVDQESSRTPFRISIAPAMSRNFDQIASLNRISADDCRLQVAYSIKTCPDPIHLSAALERDMVAEAISMAEVEAALATGWDKDRIILNGPAKWWPRSMAHHNGLHAVFCDSIEEFERLIGAGRRDKIWGLRLKIPGLMSRFGVEMATYKDISRIANAVREMPDGIEFGIHIHMASNLVGNGLWADAVQSALDWSSLISGQAGRDVNVLDLGGGYHPRDILKFDWQGIVDAAKTRLPTLKQVVIEPGRALSQDTAVVVTSVQDIRRRGARVHEVVVDTCISELPLARNYPHRLFVVTDDRLIPVRRGAGRMLGRICMEDDILAEHVEFPPSLKIGDRIVVADAGAYERSMSYEFGRGRISPSL